jgi:hypothetical protein
MPKDLDWISNPTMKKKLNEIRIFTNSKSIFPNTLMIKGKQFFGVQKYVRDHLNQIIKANITNKR